MSPTEEFFPDPHGCDFQALQNCGTVPGNSNIWYGWTYFIGAFYSNVDSSDIYEGASGGAQALTPSAGFKQRTDRKSAWVYASQQLTGPGGSSAQGLQVFANAEVNDPLTSVIHYHFLTIGQDDENTRPALCHQPGDNGVDELGRRIGCRPAMG